MQARLKLLLAGAAASAGLLYTTREKAPEAPTLQAVESAATTKPENGRAVAAKGIWPQWAAGEWNECNPFAPLTVQVRVAASGVPASETGGDLPGALSLPTSTVEMIYQHAGARVALVNGQMVRVGDALPEGRVVQITETGLVIAP